MSKLIHRNSGAVRELIKEILEKASRVFLWVTMVVKSLLCGLLHGDRLSDLQKRLQELPSDLEKLYDHMRSRVDQRYLEQAAQILQLVHHWGEPMSTLALSFACEDDPVAITMAQMTEWAPLEKNFRLQEQDRRLRSRCAGLLEIHGPAGKTNGLFECRVEFIHRTAKEYLKKTQVWKTLLSETAGSPFKNDLWLLSP